MIEIQNISFSYPDADILRGVGFTAQSGEVVGLLGNNGAGKSTLVTCLNRIRKPKPVRFSSMGAMPSKWDEMNWRKLWPMWRRKMN